LKEEIKINKVSIDVIIKTLENNNFVKIDDSYNYLLNISIYKLTKEELTKLKDNYIDLKNKIKELEETTSEKMWHNDLLKLKTSLKKYRN
jgi:DNA topoisomerase-2